MPICKDCKLTTLHSDGDPFILGRCGGCLRIYISALTLDRDTLKRQVEAFERDAEAIGKLYDYCYENDFEIDIQSDVVAEPQYRWTARLLGDYKKMVIPSSVCGATETEALNKLAVALAEKLPTTEEKL